MNVVNNNRENGVKAEDGIKTEGGAKTKDGELIDDVKYFYISGKYKNLIGKSFKLRLMDGDLHLKNSDN